MTGTCLLVTISLKGYVTNDKQSNVFVFYQAKGYICILSSLILLVHKQRRVKPYSPHVPGSALQRWSSSTEDLKLSVLLGFWLRSLFIIFILLSSLGGISHTTVRTVQEFHFCLCKNYWTTELINVMIVRLHLFLLSLHIRV